MSVQEALQTLEGAVKTAKGRAALGVLESELQAGGNAGAKAAPPNRSGFGGAKGIVRDMVARRGASARGGGTA